MGKHYVYILICNDGTYYTGYTTNIQKRTTVHNNGKGAKYTRGRTPVEVVYHQEFNTKIEAMQAEYKIKSLPRKQKEALISGKENYNVDSKKLS